MTNLDEVWRTSALPRLEILTLAAAATGCRREQLLADAGRAFASDDAARLSDWVRRREAGEPLAYLLGRREFFGRSFTVDPSVLIPRAETELLIDRSIAWIAARRDAKEGQRVRVLELGTGSGIIAITLALECVELEIMATDLSNDALRVARANAARLGADVRFVESDWFEFLRDSSSAFDLIVSNPPYIAAQDPHLLRGDLRFEPRVALTDEADGRSALRRIASGAERHLCDGGMLMLEHGYDQAAEVRSLLHAANLIDVASFRDLAGIERVTAGTRAKSVCR